MKPFSNHKEVKYSFQEKLRLALNPQTDGTLGIFRAPLNYKLIAPNNDSEAITKFLEMHANNDTTFRIYQRELVRLQMWAVLKLGIALSSMTIDNYRDYIRFMSDPDEEWCGKRAPIGSIEWRPFQAKKYSANQQLVLPSITSLTTTFGCISPYLDWLGKGGYLIGNPLSLIKSEFIGRNPPTVRDINKNSHYFDEESYQIFLNSLQEMPKESPSQILKYEQSRILISLIYYLNAKIPEVSKATMSNFIKVDNKWYWQIEKTNGSVNMLLLCDEMLEALKRWRLYLHISPLPVPNEKLSVMPACSSSCKPFFYRTGLSPRALTQILRDLVLITAEVLSKKNPEKAQHLLHASSHWLRYTKLRQDTELSKL